MPSPETGAAPIAKTRSGRTGFSSFFGRGAVPVIASTALS